MADCYGCPYRWHDEDCEYCSAKGDEIIDGKSYKKENCSYYKEYMAAKGKPVSSSSSSSSSYSGSSGSGVGCGIAIFVIVVIIAAIYTFAPMIFGGEEDNRPTASQQATAVVCNVNHALNMRDAKSQNSNVIATIPKGEKVIILEMGTDYHYVQYGEHKGYCAADCLEIQ